MNLNTFTEILKQKRILAGYSQEEASIALFLARSTYNHYETGTRIPPTETLIRISALFNIQLSELMKPLIPDDISKANPNYEKLLCSAETHLTEEETKLLSLFAGLYPEEKSHILMLMHLIKKAHR